MPRPACAGRGFFSPRRFDASSVSSRACERVGRIAPRDSKIPMCDSNWNKKLEFWNKTTEGRPLNKTSDSPEIPILESALHIMNFFWTLFQLCTAQLEPCKSLFYKKKIRLSTEKFQNSNWNRARRLERTCFRLNLLASVSVAQTATHLRNAKNTLPTLAPLSKHWNFGIT